MSKEAKRQYVNNVNKALGAGTDKMTTKEYLEALNVLLDDIEVRRDAARQDVALEDSGH